MSSRLFDCRFYAQKKKKSQPIQYSWETIFITWHSRSGKEQLFLDYAIAHLPQSLQTGSVGGSAEDSATSTTRTSPLLSSRTTALCLAAQAQSRLQRCELVTQHLMHYESGILTHCYSLQQSCHIGWQHRGTNDKYPNLGSFFFIALLKLHCSQNKVSARPFTSVTVPCVLTASHLQGESILVSA